VDLVSVTTLLNERGQLEEAGGPVFLSGLSEHVGFAANAEYYARLVHDKAVLRRLLECSQEIAGACLQPVERVEEFLDWAEHRVFQVAEAHIRQGFQPIEELVNKEIATLEAIWGRKDGALTGVQSGFPDLDNYTAGFQPGDLIIIAARPSMGKTALALNIAFNAAYGRHEKTPTPVALFSLEMSKEQLVRRLLSSEGEVDASQIRRAAFLTHQEWAQLQEAAGKLLDCPIYIDDTPAAAVLEIRAKCRRLKAEGKLGLVIIDYLQLMRGRGDAPSREQEISEISRSLKALAKELSVPVIALSQLNRRVEERPNKRPQLADLRESGAIEQDADVILFIYRDEVYKEDSPDKGTAEVIIGKQRNGPTGKVKLTFLDKFTAFRPWIKEELPVAF
jgi:replicative DNA helicase